MTNLTLYQRTQALTDRDALIADADGEITPEIEAQMAELRGSFDDKVDACVAKMRELQATADACMKEAERFEARCDRLNARAEWLKRYVHTQMTLANVTKVEGRTAVVTRVLNPPKVIGVQDAPIMRADIDALPEPLRACVKISPATPESYAWDRAALVKLAKDHPDVVATVAVIDRTERISIT